MQTTVTNPCVRCGKQRIISKTWTEYLGNFPITRTDTVCPDKDCQKEVDEDIATKKKTRDDLTAKRAKDKEDRAKLVALNTPRD